MTGIFIGQLCGPPGICSTRNLVHLIMIKGVRLNETQIINHYPNHYELVRKDLMVKNLKRFKKQLQKNQHYLAKDQMWGNAHLDFLPPTYTFPSTYSFIQINTRSSSRNFRKTQMLHGQSNPIISLRVKAFFFLKKSISSRKLCQVPISMQLLRILMLMILMLSQGISITQCWWGARNSISGFMVLFI